MVSDKLHHKPWEKFKVSRNMKVTVATLTDTVFTLEVASDMEVENFKALCEVESGIPAAEMLLLFNGQVPEIYLIRVIATTLFTANGGGQKKFS